MLMHSKSKYRNSSQKSESNTPTAIRLYCQGDESKEKRIIERLSAYDNKILFEFLTHYLEKDIERNVFSETDGYARGIADGKAEEAFTILTLITRFNHDQ